jgi:hypothetical protein
MQAAALQGFARRLWPQGAHERNMGRIVFALLDVPLAAAVSELRGSRAAARESLEWVAATLDALLGECWDAARAEAARPADKRRSAGTG